MSPHLLVLFFQHTVSPKFNVIAIIHYIYISRLFYKFYIRFPNKCSTGRVRINNNYDLRAVINELYGQLLNPSKRVLEA